MYRTARTEMRANTHKISIICDRIIEYGILLVIFIIPFRHTASVETAALLLPLIAWIVKLRYVPDTHFVKTPLNIPIMYWGIIVVLASIGSISPAYSFYEFRSQFLKQIILFFVVVNNIKTNKQILRIACILVVSACVFSIYGIYGYLDNTLTEYGRATGTFDSYSRSAVYCMLVIPLILTMFFHAKNKYTKSVLILSALLTGILLVLTFTRGPWIILFVILLILLFRKSKKILTVFLAALALLVLFYGPVTERVKFTFEIKEGINRASSGRLTLWHNSLQIIKKHPVLGVGYGPDIFRRMYPYPEYKFYITDPHGNFQQSDAHNLFLQIPIETGIAGLVIFMYLLVRCIKYTYKSYAHTEDPFKKDILFTIFLTIIGFLLCSISGYFYEDRIGLLFWLYIALSIGIGINEKENKA
ncbi:O-antigen ligase family protein [bacterium]|nr:O-antigen ligase family protein [bacterium]